MVCYPGTALRAQRQRAVLRAMDWSRGRTNEADHQHRHPNGDALRPRLLSALRGHRRSQDRRHLGMQRCVSDREAGLQAGEAADRAATQIGSPHLLCRPA